MCYINIKANIITAMKWEIRDDISQRDVLLFLGLLVFLFFWTWFVFYSGIILR